MYSALEDERGNPESLVLAADRQSVSRPAAASIAGAVTPLNASWLEYTGSAAPFNAFWSSSSSIATSFID